MSHGEPSGPELVPVEKHQLDTLATIRPLEPLWLPLDEAEGGVLAEDVLADTPLPPFDNSAMDGYAVHSADLARASAEAPVTLPVRGEIAAGDTGSYRVEPGSCLRIMTGALLPAGADAVVPVEKTDGDTTAAAFSRAVSPGESLRRQGDDVPAGARLLESGTPVGPVQLALLAGSGHATVRVRPRPRVAVVSTGNELAEPGTPLVPGQIWESNSYLLAAAARQAGVVAARYRLPDDPDAVLAQLEQLLPEADLLVTSGGVSMGGEHDVVKAALSKLGTVTFRKVAMQPGMPQGFGVLGPEQRPLFTLPGNPVSAYVSFVLFVRPALNALRDLPALGQRVLTAALTADVRSPQGRRSYLRGRLDDAQDTVAPLTGQSSHQLGALAQANALIIVPDPVTRIEAGQPVDVMVLP
jgi:molybdopterin molybdotransferase